MLPGLQNKKTLRRNRNRLKRFVPIVVSLVIFCLAIALGFFTTRFFYATRLSSAAHSAKQVTSYSEEQTIATLRKQLAQKKILVKEITGDGQQITVTLEDGQIIIFSSEKEIHLQISSLQFILSRLTMEGRRFRQLDLRFDKPVIVFEK